MMPLLKAFFLGTSLLAMLAMALLSLQPLALSLLYLWHRRRPPLSPPTPQVWPAVTVQLPVFNERFVVERLIDAVCALDYPREGLSIQVLDDSTDDTTELARRRVVHHRGRGVDVVLLHRDERRGFKAGALAEGLRTARGELIAAFDADFVPPPDFLRRVVPHLMADPRLGMVQARWGFLNPGENLVTRGQALSLDGHFVVIQTARSQSGLLLNFNGTAGIWRRCCIEEAGGWQSDTLAEDLDLSYRAQMRGWRLMFLPDVVIPSQIPPELAAYKLQQSRWAQGGIQVLGKLGRDLWRAPLSLPQRVGATFHLASYLAHPILMAFLLSVPFLMLLDVRLPQLPWLSLAGIGPPLLVALSQIGVYPDWRRRLAYFPVQVLLSIGLTLNNTLAVGAALAGRQTAFKRTPKFLILSDNGSRPGKEYSLPVDWTVWAEVCLAAYTAAAIPFALSRLPTVIPVLALCSLSFAFMGTTGLRQGRGAGGFSGAAPPPRKNHHLSIRSGWLSRYKR